MFIALQHQHLPRSSGAPCAVMRSVYMPLLTERDILEIRGYKHVAPTEQEPAICCSYGARTLDMLLLRSKNPRYVAPTEQEPSICCSYGARTVDTDDEHFPCKAE
jgi:hypothetical protein